MVVLEQFGQFLQQFIGIGRREFVRVRCERELVNPPPRCYRGSMRRFPIQGTSGSGTFTEPSAF